MELSLLLMKQILSMALMILMGFTVVRAGILKTEQSSVLSALVIYLIAPCTEISAFQVEYNSDRLQGLVIATVAAAIAHLIFITLSRIFGDLLKLFERSEPDHSAGKRASGRGHGVLYLCVYCRTEYLHVDARCLPDEQEREALSEEDPAQSEHDCDHSRCDHVLRADQSTADRGYDRCQCSSFPGSGVHVHDRYGDGRREL